MEIFHALMALMTLITFISKLVECILNVKERKKEKMPSDRFYTIKLPNFMHG